MTRAEPIVDGTWRPEESAGRIYWRVVKREPGPGGSVNITFDQRELEHGMATVRYESEEIAAARCRALNRESEQ